MIRGWVDGILRLKDLLGYPIVGLATLEAHFSSNKEVTADYVCERLKGMFSDDTVRRKLRRMEKRGVLVSRKDGRTRYYRLAPDAAAEAKAFLEGTGCGKDH